MKTIETDAIVLCTRDHGESDRLVTFHSAGFGKLRGIARGARRSRKRFANVFEPCSLVRLECRERNSYIWIEACKLLGSLSPHAHRYREMGIRGAFFRNRHGDGSGIGNRTGAFFLLHKGTLDRLERDKDPQNVLLLALLRFQALMGYMPALDGCAICRRSIRTARKWFWQPAQGKLVCEGSLLSKYRLYRGGFGDTRFGASYEEDSPRKNLAAPDAPGNEGASFDGGFSTGSAIIPERKSRASRCSIK